MGYRRLARFSPGRTILFAILSTIGIGTLLLWLPFARNTYIPPLDLVFTATTSLCVTGLSTVPLTQFTIFGHAIILILFQIGGLGLMTLTLFLVSLFTELGLTTQLMASKVLELESWKNIRKILIFIIGLTLTIEFIGACLLYSAFREQCSIPRSIFMAIFHSVSAFCNCGINLFPQGMPAYSHNCQVLSILGILMFCGGLGFITWHEIYIHLKERGWRKKIHLSLHSKIVLHSAMILIGIFTLLFWFLERHNTLAGMPFYLSFLNAFFNAIGSRSTGFTTVPIASLQLASLLLIMISCFIGSSPGSTGSGIKSTTFAIFIATLKTSIMGKIAVELKGRTIPRDQVLKAFAVIALSSSWIITILFFMLITEKSWNFIDILFEVVSAFANLGECANNISTQLSFLGKLFIAMTMVIGRIGPLTIALALHKQGEKQEFTYPEERIMIG